MTIHRAPQDDPSIEVARARASSVWHILHDEAITANVLLAVTAASWRKADVHQVELIDSIRHAVGVGRTTHWHAKPFAFNDMLSLKFEDDTVIVDPGRPNIYYARALSSSAARRHPQGHLATTNLRRSFRIW